MPQYEKSPRNRLDWFGGLTEFEVSTSTTDGAVAQNQQILREQPRLALSAGTVDRVAFPAGIVRGDSCSIARFIGHLEIYDVDRRQQNISFGIAAGLIKQEVSDEFISDPTASGAIVPAPDALEDLRASWIWHNQRTWSPQSAGANYTVLRECMEIDTKNSRIFESNDVLQLSCQIRTLQNGATQAVAVTARARLMWRCLLRLD